MIDLLIETPLLLLVIVAALGYLLGISVTMPYHLDAAMQLIQAVRAANLDRDVRILVGGYPFNIDPKLPEVIGADGYAPDAAQAVEVVNRLVRDASPQPTL